MNRSGTDAAAGRALAAPQGAAQLCGPRLGAMEHLRWPDRAALERALAFWHEHPLAGR